MHPLQFVSQWAAGAAGMALQLSNVHSETDVGVFIFPLAWKVNATFITDAILSSIHPYQTDRAIKYEPLFRPELTTFDSKFKR